MRYFRWEFCSTGPYYHINAREFLAFTFPCHAALSQTSQSLMKI